MKDLIADLAEREDLISLNLEAANAAMRSSAFHPAMRYLKSGINLLCEDHWSYQYALSLKLFSTLADVASSIGNYNLMDECVERILSNGKCIVDKFDAYYILIKSLTFQKHPDEAISKALSVLEQLGYPMKWSKADVRIVTFQTRRVLKGHTKDSILKLPDMTDEKRLKVWVHCVHSSLIDCSDFCNSHCMKKFNYGFTPGCASIGRNAELNLRKSSRSFYPR